MRATVADDVTLTGPPDWPEAGPWHGRQAFVGQFKRVAGELEGRSVSEIEVLAEDGEWVVMSFRWSGSGAVSGIETSFTFYGAWRVVDGKATEAHYRRTEPEALAAAGLGP